MHFNILRSFHLLRLAFVVLLSLFFFFFFFLHSIFFCRIISFGSVSNQKAPIGRCACVGICNLYSNKCVHRRRTFNLFVPCSVVIICLPDDFSSSALNAFLSLSSLIGESPSGQSMRMCEEHWHEQQQKSTTENVYAFSGHLRRIALCIPRILMKNVLYVDSHISK